MLPDVAGQWDVLANADHAHVTVDFAAMLGAGSSKVALRNAEGVILGTGLPRRRAGRATTLRILSLLGTTKLGEADSFTRVCF